MGRRMAKLEADVAFFGMCLRKKYVDQLFFKQLAASGIPWKDKKKVIRPYRSGTGQRVQDIRSACDRLWNLLLGKNFRRHGDYHLWSAVMRTHFDRAWYVKRRHALDSFKLWNSRGAEDKPGVQDGPTFLRAAGLVSRLEDLGHPVRDYYDVKEEDNSNVTSTKAVESDCVGKSSKKVKNAVAKVLSSGSLSLNIGGDHTMSIGTVIAHAMSVDSNISLLWVDAHGDINTPLSTSSGHIHGMPVAFLLREMEPFLRKPEGMEWIQPCVRKDNFAYIALRNIDPYERYFMDKLGITLYSMEDVDRIGITEVIRLVLRQINPGGTRSVHVSFDIDSIDKLIVPSTGTPEIGGLSMREALVIAEEVHRSGQLRVLDLAEVNPRLGTAEDADRTVNCGVDIITSFFGRERRGNLPVILDPSVIKKKED
ncbi:arginase-1 [Ixodes scapularis]|uniref:arginase-1 n=1 Tax=Ixodes scapularis TaxID=6945 RepID=UPI001A9D9B49|nr:arginase-1 [Ixodes scapularis]